MKKLLIGITALVLTVSAGLTVFAEDISYDKDSNKVTNITDVSSYSTVLISKADAAEVASESIVYVNQADTDTTFDNAVEFMLKEKPEDGQYKLTLGARKSDNRIMYFTIGDEIKEKDVSMTPLGYEPADNTNQFYNIGFNINTEEFQRYKSIKVVVTDGKDEITGGYAISDVFGTISGPVKLALQINKVPEKYKDNIQVYLSADEVGEQLVWKNNDTEEI